MPSGVQKFNLLVSLCVKRQAPSIAKGSIDWYNSHYGDIFGDGYQNLKLPMLFDPTI